CRIGFAYGAKFHRIPSIGAIVRVLGVSQVSLGAKGEDGLFVPCRRFAVVEETTSRLGTVGGIRLDATFFQDYPTFRYLSRDEDVGVLRGRANGDLKTTP
ncbi:MAG: hypothetical protein Q9214_007386, partial [Letrouitia sp. 1 TL-2023]